MNVSFRQLQLFLAFAEKGSVTAAAAACHVTQPTVSMQLAQLADAVGLPLYERAGRRLRLTAVGEALATTARGMSDDWAAFEQTAARFSGLTQGRLRIAIASTAEYFVPGLIGAFCDAHPGIEIALEVKNRDGVLARLAERRDDLYVMSMPPDDGTLARRPFLPNPLVVIAPAGHRLTAGRRIVPARFANERFVLRERGSGTRMACDAHFRALGLAPDVRLELGSNEAVKGAVAAGLGLAVLSRHALSSHERGVVELDARSFPIHANWFILHPSDRRLSLVAAAFLAHLDRATTPHAHHDRGGRSR